MKILFLTPYLPHPRAGHGAGEYLYHLIQHLSKRHQVTLCSFCDEREVVLAPELKTLDISYHVIPRSKGRQKNLLANIALAIVRIYQLARSVVFWQPYYVSKFHDARMVQLVKQITSREEFDIVQAEFTFMAQYRVYMRSGKKVLQEIDVSIRPAYRKLKNARSIIAKAIAWVELCRWMRYELRAVSSFDHVLTVTEQDRLLLKKLTKKNHISYFAHAFDIPSTSADYKSREQHSLIFVGSYSHYPNRDAAAWLCEEIFPLVQRRHPEAILYLVGPSFPGELAVKAKENSGIHILGFVKNLDKYLQRCAVFVAPLRHGGGIKNKVLYAMAYGLPVVTTSIGIEGIDGLQPDTVLLGTTPQKLAEQIGKLFDDTHLAEDVGKRGVDLVRTHYDWDRSIRDVESIYQNILQFHS